MRLHIDVTYRADDGQVWDARGIAKKAQMVEAAGFNGIYNSDSSFARIPKNGIQKPRIQPDPLAWQLMAAVATEHVEVGLACFQLPLREPVDLAQRFMTLEAMVPGRYTVGVGAGSGPGGYEPIGTNFDDRFKLLHGNMVMIRHLLNGEQVGPARIGVWPEHRGGPHFVLAAWHSEISLKRAVNDYDGWMTSCWNTTGANLVEAIKRYRDLGGKRAMATTCRIDLTSKSVKLRDDGPFHLFCPPEEAAERIQTIADLGYDDLCLRFCRSGTRAEDGEEANYTENDLALIRSLHPIDNAKPYETHEPA